VLKTMSVAVSDYESSVMSQPGSGLAFLPSSSIFFPLVQDSVNQFRWNIGRGGNLRSWSWRRLSAVCFLLCVCSGCNQSTSITIQSSFDPSIYGFPVTYTATVTSPAGSPTGKVEFRDVPDLEHPNVFKTIGTSTVTGSGLATVSSSALALETHFIEATYSGDLSYSGSHGQFLSQTINPNTTTRISTSSSSPSIPWWPVTLNAAVTNLTGLGCLIHQKFES
jgi:hypothetical protein